ncbi:MAG TPA: O-antigen ligase family protein [Solirubrobacteraceae bacterium]
MANRVAALLRQAPATVPAMGAIVLLVVGAASQAGYPLTRWAPGGLVLIGLLGVSLAAVGARRREIPVAVKIAVACLACYTALSFLSITWAAVPGDAWEGANRTLLYLLVFVLFACFGQRGASAALLLITWVLAIAALAAFVAVHIDVASDASLQTLAPFGRLIYPSGYVNANAALWLMAAWPALLLARSPRLPWPLRGALAGAAVLLGEVALLSQSRGSVYATAVMLVLAFALVPGRVRTFALLVPVAAGIAAAAPAILHVGNHVHDGRVDPGAVHEAVLAMFASAVVVALVACVGCAIEAHRRFSPIFARRLHRSLGALAVTVLIALLAAGWAAAGDPVTRVRHAWDTFTSVRGYGANTSGSRLVSGLGSNRYDFYRVALNEFVAHPLVGIGADNFQQQYLVHGRSSETPRYPHSVELRTLTDTGTLGALIALGGLAAALFAGARASRRRSRGELDPLAAPVAVAALAGFAYWLVHGSFDWFWEFAGLGGAAFALLGLACSLSPRPVAPVASTATTASPVQPGKAGRSGSRAPTARRLQIAAAVIVALAACVSLGAPWLSQLELQRAARIWPHAPRKAYSTLEQAASLDPLGDEAYLVAGGIAVRFGDLSRADREFARALARTPGDAYATLERGAIASALGDRVRATALLEKAVRLNPRDALARRALSIARGGRRIDVQQLNRLILLGAGRLA